MTKCLRLVVPSQITYTLNVLSSCCGVTFPDKQVVDVPLETREQVDNARKLAQWFVENDGRTVLRNCPSAVDVYSIEMIDLP